MNWKTLTLAALVVPALAFAACADPEETTTAATTQNPQPNQGGGGSAGTMNTGGSGGSEEDCPHEGPAIIDPALFPACPSYVCGGGAHCIDKGLVPDEMEGLLAECNKDWLCVPDVMIETNGNFLLTSCTAVLGLEGRCLSECIPQVADQADMLQQGICPDGELCTPCFDPFTQEPTGACEMTCDPGPSEPPPAPLPTCCPGNNGTCVPGDLVPPDSAQSLAKDSCPDSGDLCVPNEFLDPTFDPIPCAPGPILQGLGIDEGVCVPDCVDAVKGIGAGSCSAGYKCAPCEVMGESTGACGEDW